MEADLDETPTWVYVVVTFSVVLTLAVLSKSQERRKRRQEERPVCALMLFHRCGRSSSCACSRRSASASLSTRGGIRRATAASSAPTSLRTMEVRSYGVLLMARYASSQAVFRAVCC